MWAHYSANHTGIVIEFDLEHPFFTGRRSASDDLSGLHPVVYSTSRPTLKEIKSLMHEGNGWVPLFFSKNQTWAYEEEWRVVQHLKTADKVIDNPAANIHLFQLPAACIKGIVLGCQMPDENRQKVREFLRADGRYEHTTLSVTCMSASSYDLEIAEMEK